MRTRSPHALRPRSPRRRAAATRPASSRSLRRSIRRPRSRAAGARRSARRRRRPRAPCPSSLSAPKLSRSAPSARSGATPMAVSAGLALDSALAQAGPAAAATPCSSSSATSACPCRPSISASECPGVRSARSPTNVTPGTPRRQRDLVAVAHGAVARVAPAIGCARRPAPRPGRRPARRFRSPAAARAPGRRRRARAASVARPRPQSSPAPLGPPSLWPATAAVTAPGSEPMSTSSAGHACTASRCSGTPRSAQISAASATGWITPVRLLAQIRLQTRSPGCTAPSSALDRHAPVGVHRQRHDLAAAALAAPRRLRSPQDARAAS